LPLIATDCSFHYSLAAFVDSCAQVEIDCHGLPLIATNCFFDSCAQIEIDDYRDYEKALGALREAHEWMGKARVQDKDAKVASLAQRISHVEAFVRARKTVKTEPEETVRAPHSDRMRIACGLHADRMRIASRPSP
jgi:hypothetical protein